MKEDGAHLHRHGQMAEPPLNVPFEVEVTPVLE
jgi:hypothetical protein